MKKIKYVLFLSLCVSLLTGCVKYNASMDIKKDKSMDFKVIYAVDASMSEDETEDAEVIANLKNSGYTVSSYSENNMKGYTISKSYSNIDDVSTEQAVEYDLEGTFDTTTKEVFFTVKKGFLKNTYKANFKFDTSSYPMDETDFDETDFDETDFELETDGEIDDMLDSIDYTSMMANLDLSFNVTLPYAAKSNNATSTSNQNKTLTWNLVSLTQPTMQFEFELYNMKNIYLCIGGAAILVILLIVMVVAMIKKGKKKTEVPTQSVENPVETNVVEPIQPVQQPVAPATMLAAQTVPQQSVQPENSQNPTSLN